MMKDKLELTIKSLKNSMSMLDDDNQEGRDLYEFLLGIYQTKRKELNNDSDSEIFADIVITALQDIDCLVEGWENSVVYMARVRIIELLRDKYSVSKFNYLRIIVFGFINYMYEKYQQVSNTYVNTKKKILDNNGVEPGSEEVTLNMGGVSNRYIRLKKEFDNIAKNIHLKDDFERFNVNAKYREVPVSTKIAEANPEARTDEKSKKINRTEKVLLDYEYDIYSYIESGEFNDWFRLGEKLLSGTIWDKKHYPNKSIISGLECLENLYKKILSENKPNIEKCAILIDLECKYKIEMYYKWLKALKSKNICATQSIMDLLGMLNSFFVCEEYINLYFPLKNAIHINTHRVNCINSLYLFNDVAIDSILKTENTLDKYLDRIIILNFIRDMVLESLEIKYGARMKTFDFYNCKELNEFLDDFVGKGQHITFNKHPKKDIDMDLMRKLYQNIFYDKDEF